jgi:rare lipoprotein A
VASRCLPRYGFWLSVVVATTLLAGCASAPKPAGPQVWKPSTNPGGYYQDDGPSDNPPPDLASVADAEPKDEPLQRLANQSYEVMGNRYVPDISNKPYKAQGLASWYGRKFHGKKTSSGEPYDMYAMTAAHRTLPIPSYARISNVKTGKSVVVRINDRGPFHPDRLIDLSHTAALKLGLLGQGSALVEVERVFAADNRVATSTVSRAAEPPAPTALAITSPSASDAPRLFLQLGAFETQANAEAFRDKLQQQLNWLNESIRILPRGSLFSVRLGPYATRVEAGAIAEKIRATLDLAPLVSVE